MTFVFASSVPPSERRWIAQTIRWCARRWKLGEWEVRVSARNMGQDCAEVSPHPAAHIVDITLHSGRFEPRGVLRADLLHEMWHLVTWDVEEAMDDLAAHISDPAKRSRAIRRARRRYETWHDRTARLWDRPHRGPAVNGKTVPV